MTNGTITVSLPDNMERKFAMLVQIASDYKSRIYISYQNKKVNAKSIMGMMALPLCNGEDIIIEADGDDEIDAIQTLASFLTSK